MVRGAPPMAAASVVAVLAAYLAVVTGVSPTGAAAASVIKTSGEMRRWHPVELNLVDGPWASESDANNPFLNFRLTATFTSPAASSRKYVIPCFWAADGKAAHTGATAGSVWRCLFTPDQTGMWRYAIEFKSGVGVALKSSGTGTPVTPFDGQIGSFRVSLTNKTGRDFRGKGKLRVVPPKRHLRFDDGEFFMKHGADSPENFLGYRGFDGSAAGKHAYAPHVGDWRRGDPTWGKSADNSKGIVGAVNYLASVGVNAIYAMPMTIDGDAKDTWPWTSARDVWRYDVSKLAQWGLLFDHMDAVGVVLHMVLSETENEELFERADAQVDRHGFSDARRLYYRELVARFGAKNGLVWNLGEENGWADGSGQVNTDSQRKAFLGHFAGLEPYGALLALHTFPADKQRVYTPLLGWSSPLTGASLQVAAWPNVHKETIQWVHASAAAGKPWVVSVDEIGGAGVLTDAETPDHNRERRDVLWGALTAGAAGVEWYSQRYDQTLESYRDFERLWATTDRAMRLLTDARVPYWEMGPADWRIDGKANWALAGKEAILAYLPRGGRARVWLTSPGAWTVGWFNPRLGGTAALQGVRTIIAPTAGGRAVVLGTPPRDGNKDWVVLLRRNGASTAPPPPPSQPALPPSAPSTVDGPFALYVFDTVTGKDVKGPLMASVTLRRADLPAWFSIRADRRPGSSTIGGVRFLVNGAAERVEMIEPFFIAGDFQGTVFPWTKSPCVPTTIEAVSTASGDRSTVRARFVC
ncbi:hypothetical protein BU14_0587s0006 [Porphyra umbilicalis]|uniref:DUF5060 domain-containing protein n=1 Tax=Porphyra umbilicalis TaxID=2786 RepID=A0A1X6NRE1_PORUM|nr:hypothetical protein BU14_0587s0006 [Porphyra umbilicalis]|eukprot:OSX71145.1 hypothetical protein BU14_0587s0006 [Porphyra umbilicalis]